MLGHFCAYLLGVYFGRGSGFRIYGGSLRVHLQGSRKVFKRILTVWDSGFGVDGRRLTCEGGGLTEAISELNASEGSENRRSFLGQGLGFRV